MKNKAYFVTAIGTDIGKTLVSSILVNALEADYWKPVQCGNLDFTDSDFIRKYTEQKVFPEKYKFSLPASPHQASSEENVHIQISDFSLPETTRKLIVEGAGGMMVPLNSKNDLVIDIARKWELPLIVVSSFYLGSINHTLLTLEYAQTNHMNVAMLIFTGENNPASLEAIRHFFPNLKIGFIPKLEVVNEQNIHLASKEFAKNYLHELV